MKANSSVVTGALAMALLMLHPQDPASQAALTMQTTDAGRPAAATDLDARVQAYLVQREGTWRDLNVPAVDGQTLHNLVLERRFTRALEIGTSTGHSGLWIAWALSKTGGRLTTIEIDPGRHQRALAHFRAAGLDRYIDARLGDAHELTRTLAGPWDFVFSDADKDWYVNYLAAVWPRLVPGGCFTAHNVARRGGGSSEFLAALDRLADGHTTIDRSSWSGMSITCKTPTR